MARKYVSYGHLAGRLRNLHRQRSIAMDEVTEKDYDIALWSPQRDVLDRAERLINLERNGVLCVRQSRQTGKNEIAAILHTRVLARYRSQGGTYVRCAPTWKPQIINSLLRLEKYLLKGLVPGYRPRYGYLVQADQAFLFFLSADKTANVKGATASIALDMDEAQDIDREAFELRFAPFTASTNAPMLMWGTAGYKDDLLYHYRQHNLKNGREDLCIDLPAADWLEFWPEYAAHYKDRCNRLGKDHFIIKTNYDLIDTERQGTFLNSRQIVSILDSVHERQTKPPDGRMIVMVVDIAGAHEEGEILDPDAKHEASRDSTVCHLVEVNVAQKAMRYQWPHCRVLQTIWWVGKSYAENALGMAGQQEELLKLCQRWSPMKVVVDARGLGEQIASYLDDRYPSVEMYKGTSESVSDDVFAFLGMVNNEQLKYFRNDNSPEHKEMAHQLQAVSYTVNPGGKINLRKPKSGAGRHIDFVKALTYVPRACKEIVERLGGSVGIGVTSGENPL